MSSTQSTPGRCYVDDETELAGIPADVLAAARAAAQADGKPGWKLTLRMPCYLPVMQYAESRDLRRRMHEAYATHASELGANPQWDNGPIIERILVLRREEAVLLGYRSFAEVSLVPKMAQTPAEVTAFLRDLAARARPFAQRDYADLVAFARSRPRVGRSWAVGPGLRVRTAQGGPVSRISEQEVRQYFPEDEVLAGLFRVTETIYGVRIREVERADVASVGAVLRNHRRRRRARRPVLLRPLCARKQAGRRMDGRCHQPPPQRRARCSTRSPT